ncbi:hypothetical protein LUX12_14475 [Streptomyces somaliensis]|uniref:hypothetical protein n=1 Tax=Streptomyces somaliensis TaxID=78355 RepID=UPI0020CD330F|nr:hypothetical protein [Streptomyces somaliensis]MCP9945726.1 hypothetical protein [Streptomyces somaliensis]MCP9961098.1 hypothetical protein [Streptomyces somaliensis]MCP9973890.1 hypothetical protein [Streptomyces somaliensis]
MSTWLRDETPPGPAHAPFGTAECRANPFQRPGAHAPRHSSQVTAEGAEWLASASPHPASALAPREAHPGAPAVLTCGTVFDVVNAPAVFGRRLLDRLWEEGPGSGPVAAHLGRVLLFTAPGTSRRLPALLAWEEWGDAVPPLLYHGVGDAVTVPPPAPGGGEGPRWLVAPDTLSPWLPGPEVVLWACVRVARATSPGDVRVSISPHAGGGASVYDVSRRR